MTSASESCDRTLRSALGSELRLIARSDHCDRHCDRRHAKGARCYATVRCMMLPTLSIPVSSFLFVVRGPLLPLFLLWGRGGAAGWPPPVRSEAALAVASIWAQRNSSAVTCARMLSPSTFRDMAVWRLPLAAHVRQCSNLVEIMVTTSLLSFPLLKDWGLDASVTW